MISVITYCRQPLADSVQERNVIKTVGTEYEYLVIDGSTGPMRTAAAYNWALAQAKGEIVVFLADDCYFMNMNWGQALWAKFAQDKHLGIVGVAGTQYLFADKHSWTAAGRPFVKGRIMYHLQNGDFFAAVFSPERADHEVVVCDGCFMAVRAPLFNMARFDEKTFDGQHFYDLDFCLQVRNKARIIVTGDVTVKKMAQPVFDDEWNSAGRVFLQKHQNVLPAACTDAVPDPEHLIPSLMVNLKGRTSPETIC
jgi:hypothetical protein